MSARFTSLAVLAASQLAWHPGVLAQPTPVGTEFQVNSYTTNHQSVPSVSRAQSAGSFVVVWESIGSGGTDTSVESIQGQRYDSNGMAVGAQFQVNTYTFSNQRRPSVATDAGGGFVVVWDSFGTTGTDVGLTASIQAQRYDSNGVPLGTQFQVNTYTTGDQLSPQVSPDGAGNFVVVWQSAGSAGTDTSLTSIQGQRYDSAGVAQGGQFQVNTFTTSRQQYPAVTVNGFGEFVVVWHSSGSAGTDTSYSSIQGQRYDSAGVAQGGQFQVNTYTTSFQYFPRVAAQEPGGNFVVVWQSAGSAGTDASGYSIQAQRYNSAGVPQGGEFQVNTYTTFEQSFPAVSADGLGFVVVWQSNGSAGTDASSNSVQGQKYDTAGLAEGVQFQVNTYTTNTQLRPAVAEYLGSFNVVWQSTNGSTGTDTDLGSIQGQLYSIPVVTTTSSSTTSSTTLPGDLLPGRVTVIKPATLAKFVAKPLTGDTFAPPTVNPVAVGGTLRIFDVAATAGDDTYALPVGTPPLGWKGLGNPAGSKGYKYKGAGTPSDPCKVVLVKETVIKGVCKGTGITLAPPFTGDVGVVLSLGATDRYCAQFGGDIVKTDATIEKRKNAPAPGACP